MFIELRELLCSEAIRRHPLGAKDLLTPTSLCLNNYTLHVYIRQVKYKKSQMHAKTAAVTFHTAAVLS